MHSRDRVGAMVVPVPVVVVVAVIQRPCYSALAPRSS